MSEFYTEVRNPKWGDAAHTMIDCEVNFKHLAEDFVPFMANPNDVMEYSKTIFDECVAGQYGEVAEYTPPMPNVAPQEEQPPTEGTQTL
jgi:hypothetical protein